MTDLDKLGLIILIVGAPHLSGLGAAYICGTALCLYVAYRIQLWARYRWKVVKTLT